MTYKNINLHPNFLIYYIPTFIGCEKETKKLDSLLSNTNKKLVLFALVEMQGLKIGLLMAYLKGEKLINYNNGEPNSNYISGFVHQAKAYKD